MIREGIMTEQEARAIYHQGEEAVVAKLMEFDARLKRLEDIINMNSHNSSKPPSTDNKLTKTKKIDTPKSKKQRGGQKGHKGNNLKIVATPDKIKALYPTQCSCCNSSLENINSFKFEKRQLFDLPKIKMQVREYQAHSIECKECHTINKAEFPDNLNAITQYGDNLKALISYLNTYQMIPYERISEMIKDLTAHSISVGSIYNFLVTHYDKLDNFETILKRSILKEDIINSDETGVHVKNKLHWIHVTSSSVLTYYMIHKKRGSIAMDDMEIIPNYSGILVHDHWKAYNKYDNCKHSYCNAHILRELTATNEQDSVQWSEDMHKLLTNMNIAVHKAKDNNKIELSKAQIQKFTKNYEKITKSAENYYPPPDNRTKKTKGRPKQEKGKNLLDRLSNYQNETLRFLNDFRVPFTNNLAERDLRMIKVKEKISGSFAGFKGGEIFCRIRSYISTLKKNNIAVLQGLSDALNGKAYMPIRRGY